MLECMHMHSQSSGIGILIHVTTKSTANDDQVGICCKYEYL